MNFLALGTVSVAAGKLSNKKCWIISVDFVLLI